MRVIAGKYGGIPLRAVPGKQTRPTTDKIKESLFNLLGQYFEGGNVLDYYAGTGALGIEALSRGATHVYACERDRQALATIEANVAKVHCADDYTLLAGNNRKRLAQLRKQNESLTFDYVFLDPPYKQQQIIKDIEYFTAENFLHEGSLIICELSEVDQLPDTIAGAKGVKRAHYGITNIAIYRVVE
ncbi:MAG: 16S rRNA (guanine(966)-N(2))-methyltransferase RsmD [Aerococcus sp.]|nr:16S rRNA (guanine(966)-N(2))-methyltransferase RsmD [Aerococcus sp.]